MTGIYVQGILFGMLIGMSLSSAAIKSDPWSLIFAVFYMVLAAAHWMQAVA